MIYVEGTIDQVKIRVRTHAPNDVWEREFMTINEAIEFLLQFNTMVKV